MKRLATLCLFQFLCPLLFQLLFTMQVWDTTEERVLGWSDAVLVYFPHYPVVFQAENVA